MRAKNQANPKIIQSLIVSNNLRKVTVKYFKYVKFCQRMSLVKCYYSEGNSSMKSNQKNHVLKVLSECQLSESVSVVKVCQSNSSNDFCSLEGNLGLKSQT